jgi:hypothetical protein
MDKIPIILGVILLAVIIGVIAGFVVGPVYLEKSFLTDLLGITTAEPPAEAENAEPPEEAETTEPHQTENTSEEEPATEPEIEPEPEAVIPNYPIVGKWEVSELIEVDPENMGEVFTDIEFFADKTGAEYHTEDPKQREFTWETESGRLTITPIDPSYRIRTYDYEIDGDLLTIFFNRNRTSYFEAVR